jgi:hypothetical protein
MDCGQKDLCTARAKSSSQYSGSKSSIDALDSRAGVAYARLDRPRAPTRPEAAVSRLATLGPMRPRLRPLLRRHCEVEELTPVVDLRCPPTPRPCHDERVAEAPARAPFGQRVRRRAGAASQPAAPLPIAFVLPSDLHVSRTSRLAAKLQPEAAIVFCAASTGRRAENAEPGPL